MLRRRNPRRPVVGTASAHAPDAARASEAARGPDRVRSGGGRSAEIPRLPGELLIKIFRYVSSDFYSLGENYLLRCAAASREFYALAMPLLYEKFMIYGDEVYDSVMHVLSTSRLAGMIKELRVVNADMAGVSFALLRGLRKLDLYLRADFPNGLTTLSHLQKLEVTCLDTEAAQALEHLRLPPSVEDLRLSNKRNGGEIPPAVADNIATDCPNLRRLELAVIESPEFLERLAIRSSLVRALWRFETRSDGVPDSLLCHELFRPRELDVRTSFFFEEGEEENLWWTGERFDRLGLDLDLLVLRSGNTGIFALHGLPRTKHLKISASGLKIPPEDLPRVESEVRRRVGRLWIDGDAFGQKTRRGTDDAAEKQMWLRVAQHITYERSSGYAVSRVERVCSAESGLWETLES
ncbi:hypothetical protein DFJ74DRAFT_711238 [Hyaloraphidium curvatum]|nr:hypothetical protein DFJ74DRAFT_711238 [Hyaloraphidium curvatum]